MGIMKDPTTRTPRSAVYFPIIASGIESNVVFFGQDHR